MYITPQVEALAAELYRTYCHSVGGKAFNGDPLPDWSTFRGDPQKVKQSNAWLATACRAIECCGNYKAFTGE